MNSKKAVDRIMKVLGLTYTQFYEAQTEQGVQLKMEGELEVGHPIYVATEEGLIPAPAGSHKLDDGTEIEVDEEGKVSKIKMGEVEEDETEDVKKEDEDEAAVTKEDDMSSELFGDVELIDGTILRMEGEGEIVGRRLKKVGYDGTLSAVADGEYETKGGKVIQVIGGAIEGVQSVSDNKKRKTGFGDLDWDKCMEEQLTQYGDEDTAKKVCGAIKAGAMSAMFAKATDKSGTVLSAPDFKMGEEIKVVMGDGSLVRAKDQGYDIKVGDKEFTIFVTDGKISSIEPMRKGAGPEDVDAKFVEAKTADGAIVDSKTFDVGEDIYVIKDGEKEKAPNGEHQVVLKDSEGNEVKIRVIVKDGVITERENVEEKDEAMEKMAALFAQALKRVEDKIDAYASKQKELEGKVEKFAKAPAGSRVYTQKTINEEINPFKEKFEAFKRMRMED
jgi:hypothetical protein